MRRLPSGNPIDKYEDTQEAATLMRWTVCDTCAVQFAIPVILQQMRAEDDNPIYCPNGHQNFYVLPDDATDQYEKSDPLKQENIRLRHLLDQTEAKLRDQRTARTESNHAPIKPNTQVTDDDAVLQCPYCDRKLKNKRGLTHHVRKAHRDELEGGA